MNTNDTRELLERTGERVDLSDLAFERLLRRRDRRIRNRRIGGLATAAAIVIGFAAFAVQSQTNLGRGAGTDPPPTSMSPARSNLFVSLDGDDRRPLPRSFEGASMFDVSPDGTQVAFSGWQFVDPTQPFSWDGYVANLDGTGIRQITPPGVDAWGLHWSPDGRSLVYQGLDASMTRPGFGDLFVIDVSTGRITQITHLEQTWDQKDGAGRFLAPSFTPDGSEILFHVPRSWPAWDLWTVPVTGGEPTLLRRNALGGAYSPDGRSLAYLTSPVRGDLTTVSLRVVDVDGGEPRTLVEGPALLSPWWSPDGTMVAYVKDTTTYVVDVATGESRQVIRGAGHEDWVDDDTLIVFLADKIR